MQLGGENWLVQVRDLMGSLNSSTSRVALIMLKLVCNHSHHHNQANEVSGWPGKTSQPRKERQVSLFS